MERDTSNKNWRENRKKSKSSYGMKDFWPDIGSRWCSGASVFTLRHAEPIPLQGEMKGGKDLKRILERKCGTDKWKVQRM